MSQTNAILNALIRGEALTRASAMQLYGCQNLTARIADIRRRGIHVVADIRKAPGCRSVAVWTIPDYVRTTIKEGRGWMRAAQLVAKKGDECVLV
jgi:hypothetical protein